MEASRRGFLGGLLAVAAVAVVPVVWTAEKIYSLFNVKDFGARGDGITDDTAAIQAAIDASLPGGKVYFPAGVYRMSAPLRVGDSNFYGDS